MLKHDNACIMLRIEYRLCDYIHTYTQHTGGVDSVGLWVRLFWLVGADYGALWLGFATYREIEGLYLITRKRISPREA